MPDKKTRADVRRLVRRMNLMSDTLFHAVAMHNKAAVELIIRIVLRRKDIVAGMG